MQGIAGQDSSTAKRIVELDVSHVKANGQDRLMGCVIQFESYYRSVAGKTEFKGRKGSFPQLTQEEVGLDEGIENAASAI
jgi:hypothetical protein